MTALTLLWSLTLFADTEPPVRGVEAIDWRACLERFTEQGPAEEPSIALSVLPDFLLQRFDNAIINTENPVQKFGSDACQMASIFYRHSQDKISRQKLLVDALLQTKERFRHRLDLSGFKKARYQAILFLQTLAEEVAYLISLDFPELESIAGTLALKNLRRPQKTADLTPFTKVTTSDVLLSKGDSGSSSFLARITDIPGSFSHATSVYINPQNEIYLPEAEIEDGVKLRSSITNYQMTPKKKLFVYRYHDFTPTHESQIAHATEQFVLGMTERALDHDPINHPSNEYDFAMDPSEANFLFCSEIVYWMYEPLLLTNPYTKNLWSTVSLVTKSFFKDYLGIVTSQFPAPSDLEWNNSFDTIAYEFTLQRKKSPNPPSDQNSWSFYNLIAEDRVDTAMVDAAIWWAETHHESVEDFLKKVSGIGNEPLSDEQMFKYIQFVEKMGQPISPALQEKLMNRPHGINLKQLLFFAFLNEVITPKIRVSSMSSGKTDLLTLRQNVLESTASYLRQYSDFMESILHAVPPLEPK